MKPACTSCGIVPGSLIASVSTAPMIGDWLGDLRKLVACAQQAPDADPDSIISSWVAEAISGSDEARS